ncbi:MAG: hypothetical protein XD74_1686 [Actinobacteria bacterium 66_15]|jgi:hypothetical protein|nr:MAG: hypothetical protein XD74_1686 [Actinobacteria bacterium 66_15]
MRSVHVVELLPDDELLPEIDVVGVVEQLVELEQVAGDLRGSNPEIFSYLLLAPGLHVWRYAGPARSDAGVVLLDPPECTLA